MCKHPRDKRSVRPIDGATFCDIERGGCGKVIDPEAQKRGRNNSSRGKRHSLAINRKYGLEHVENDSHSGKRGPIDGLGARWKQQNKTRQAPVPVEWATIFAGLEGVRDGRLPRLLIRYLPGPGIKAQDFMVVRGEDWLNEYGRDD